MKRKIGRQRDEKRKRQTERRKKVQTGRETTIKQGCNLHCGTTDSNDCHQDMHNHTLEACIDIKFTD